LPFFRRLPVKRGFTNINRIEWQAVNLDSLGKKFRANAKVTPETLAKVGLVKSLRKPVVLLGRGELSKPLKVKVHRISKSAKAKLEAAGGSIELIKA
jgi:large subunit ribosomal protein L15